jgi:monoamine oxidase
MSSDIVDVLIIGGGLAGLAAGNYLFEHGINNFLILEARDRVGGRTCTIDYKQHSVDVGGAYVGPFQNRILRLAREFNIRTYRLNNKGKNVLTLSNGNRSVYTGTIPTSMGVFALLDLNYLLCRTQELCEQISNITPWSNEDLSSKYDRMTLEDWLQTLAETDEAKELYRAAARTILCVEPNEVSMFAWLSYMNNGLGIMRFIEVDNGAQERKFYGGSQQISNRLREKLGFNRVLLNHVVKHIQWPSTSDLVKVTCDNNEVFSCRHVIIALAPSLYKTIEFEPELPEKKREATERMYMGSIIKTIAVFERSFWKENGFSGSVLDTSHALNPIIFSYDDSSDEDQFYALMGFVVADSSRKWAKQTRDERRQAVLEQYARAFQCNDILTGCREYIEHDWSAEQFSGGCYMDIMPKELLSSLREQLSTSCGNNGQLFFAGTELATRFSGYMDGAVQSGERAAFEVITKYLRIKDENLSLKWIEEEPVDDREECRSPDINKLMYGPSKIEMLLPKASTVKSILKVTSIGLLGLVAIIIKSKFLNKKTFFSN